MAVMTSCRQQKHVPTDNWWPHQRFEGFDYKQLADEIQQFGQGMEFIDRRRDVKLPVPGTYLLLTGGGDLFSDPDLPETVLRTHFNLIGSVRGVKEVANENRFWQEMGSRGARWLIRQLDDRYELPKLWSISGILSQIASVSILPVLGSLSPEDHQPENVAISLLSALSGMPQRTVSPYRVRINGILRHYLRHPDDAVRTQAASATSILPSKDAKSLLQQALRLEHNPDVRVALEDELADRSH